MQLPCEHCGREFTITADQLGGRGRCPHCRGEIELPRAADPAGSETLAPRPITPAPRGRWLENSISGLASLVFHMLLILALALVSYGGRGGAGWSEEVLIGRLPSEQLVDAGEETLAADEEVVPAREEELLLEPLETASSGAVQPSDADQTPALSALAPSGGARRSFDAGALAASGAAAGGGWDGLLRNLRRNGLDIVLTFDSTGSMSGEIYEVKQQIRRIGAVLLRLVPKARISICTYRDEKDEYVVKGLPLTDDLERIEAYLYGVGALGGGDEPEAVHAGLRWSIANNEFRPRARKVVLLFGDAPPHRQRLRECLEIASDFNSRQKGVVSTVTCRSDHRIDEFVQIAQMGGGEAFLTSDERQIMTQLMVLVFGSQYRSKVLDAFRLLER